jgi:hypothetical protein
MFASRGLWGGMGGAVGGYAGNEPRLDTSALGTERRDRKTARSLRGSLEYKMSMNLHVKTGFCRKLTATTQWFLSTCPAVISWEESEDGETATFVYDDNVEVLDAPSQIEWEIPRNLTRGGNSRAFRKAHYIAPVMRSRGRS